MLVPYANSGLKGLTPKVVRSHLPLFFSRTVAVKTVWVYHKNKSVLLSYGGRPSGAKTKVFHCSIISDINKKYSITHYYPSAMPNGLQTLPRFSVFAPLPGLRPLAIRKHPPSCRWQRLLKFWARSIF